MKNFIVVLLVFITATGCSCLKNAFAKRELKTTSDNILYSIVVLLVSAIVLAVFGGMQPVSSDTLRLSIVFGVLVAAEQIVGNEAFRHGSMSLTDLMANGGLILTIAFACIVWKETLTPLRAAGILLMLLAMVLIVNPKAEIKSKTDTRSKASAASKAGIASGVDTTSSAGAASNVDTTSSVGAASNVDTTTSIDAASNIDTTSNADTASNTDASAPAKASARRVNWLWVVLSLLLFTLCGTLGIIQKMLALSGHSDEIYGFLFYNFIVATAVTVLYLIYNVKIRREPVTVKLFGNRDKLLLSSFFSGLCNSLLHITTMLAVEALPATVAFPIVDGGKLFFITIMDVLLFRQKLTRTQITGLVLATAAIVILA